MSIPEVASALSLGLASHVAQSIHELARLAAHTLPASSPAWRLAQKRVVRPIDYMRHAEFTAVLHDLEISPGSRVLDVSSPQWFSIYLASTHPTASFVYINIIESELEPYREIAQALRLDNLEHRIGDVRELEFQDASFDRAISISVIEHVYPEVGGDSAALDEIERVLVPGGECLITIPFKNESNVVRVDGAVYERGAEKDNFFAREYDQRTFSSLVDGCNLSLEGTWIISEQVGAGAVDFYEWGPGKRARLHSAMIRSRILLQALGRSVDGALARRYLRVSREPQGRLVNIAARLRKASA